MRIASSGLPLVAVAVQFLHFAVSVGTSHICFEETPFGHWKLVWRLRCFSFQQGQLAKVSHPILRAFDFVEVGPLFKSSFCFY